MGLLVLSLFEGTPAAFDFLVAAAVLLFVLAAVVLHDVERGGYSVANAGFAAFALAFVADGGADPLLWLALGLFVVAAFVLRRHVGYLASTVGFALLACAFLST